MIRFFVGLHVFVEFCQSRKIQNINLSFCVGSFGSNFLLINYFLRCNIKFCLFSDKNEEIEKSGKSSSIELLAQELEEKILVFSRKTEELETEEARLENERMENIKNAEFLKKAHKEVENARAVIQETMASFFEKEKKLNEMQLELERREKKLNLDEVND